MNPGNIKEFDGRVAEIAKGRGCGRNSDPDRCERRLAGQALHGERYGRATPEALVESALWEASLYRSGFGDIQDQRQSITTR